MREIGNKTRLAVLLALAVGPFNAGCYHYYVKADRVAPATEWRSRTQAAWLWGLVQPDDVVPENCPSKVPLAEVSASMNFGYVLLGTLSLGTVLLHRVEWRCATNPGEVDVVFEHGAEQTPEVARAAAVSAH